MSQVLEVVFGDSRTTYSYVSSTGQDVDIGQYVVVDTPRSGYAVAKVIAIHGCSKNASKHIVTVIDDAPYKKRQADAVRAQNIRAELFRLEAAESETERFARVAKNNPQARKLLKELKELGA